MSHVKTILSVAVSMALYASVFPCTASSPDDGQISLAANQGAQSGAYSGHRQQTITPSGDQTRDRIRLREDPDGTPNPTPPGKNPRDVELQGDQQQDQVRTRLREDPDGTPNPTPPGKNPRDVELQADQQQDQVRTRLREDPDGTPNPEPPGQNPLR